MQARISRHRGSAGPALRPCGFSRGVGPCRGANWIICFSFNTVHLNQEFFFPRPLGERGDRKAEGAPRFASSGGEGVELGTVSISEQH
jgi:hypothetical protein